MTRLFRLDDWLLLGLASGLTTLWLGLWVRWSLVAWFSTPPPPLTWLLALLLAGLASAGLARLTLGPRPVARVSIAALGAGVSLLLTLLVVGPPFVVALSSGVGFLPLAARALPPFLAASWAWWQGQQLGRGPLGRHALSAVFYTGVLALAPLLVLNGLLVALSPVELLAALLLFFGMGLSGLALSSLRQLRPTPHTAFAVGRQWLLLSTAVIGGVLGAGLVAARWLAPAALPRLAQVLALAADTLALALGQLLALLVSGLGAAFASGFPTLSRFLERFITNLALALSRLQGLLAALAQLLSLGGPALFRSGPLGRLLAWPLFQAGTRWAGLLALVLLAALAFGLALRRLWGLPALSVDEQRDSVLSGRLLLAQLQALLHRPTPSAAAPPAYLSLSGPPDDTRRLVRQAYQGMLEWAHSLRLPRAAGQTPGAYAQTLAGAVPAGHDAIDVLTEAYVLARYAAEAPSPEQARQAQSAMARLKALRS